MRAVVLANDFFHYRLVSLLIEKGVLSQAEGASAFTATANDVRSGTEDESDAEAGELVASAMEKMAGWCLNGRD